MPLYYGDVPGALQTTNGSANTTNDCFFIKPGSARTVWLVALNFIGRGAGLTAITGLAYRVEQWTTTASAGGTGITPAPLDPGYQAAKHTCGYSASAVTPGTGGPLLKLAVGSSATGPLPWVAPNQDQAPSAEAGANQSIDVFNISGGLSLNFEMSATAQE